MAKKAISDIRLGNRVQDIVTGFTGIAVAKVEYLTGCTQFCVQPASIKVDDPKMPESIYLDYQRLRKVDDGITALASNTGGSQRDVPSSTPQH